MFSDNFVNICHIYSGANPWRALYTVVAVSNSIISFIHFIFIFFFILNSLPTVTPSIKKDCFSGGCA